MKQFKYVLASILSVLAPATAQADSGDDLKLVLDGKSTSVQRILVIPVVGAGSPYDPTNRSIEPAFPGAYTQLDEKYNGAQGATGYWQEASYGRIQLQADISTCYYQIGQLFPNASEPEYEVANVTGHTIFPYIDGGLSHLVLRFVGDPALGEQVADLTLDPTAVLTTPAELETALNDALVAAGVSGVLKASLTGEMLSGNVVFQVEGAASVTGSYVRVDRAQSDPETRNLLGLTKPTIQQVSPTRIVVTTDGAGLPDMGANASLPHSDGQFAIDLFQAGSFADSFTWTLNYSCSALSDCPRWSNINELRSYVYPASFETGGIVNEVVVNGRRELEFVMDFGSEVSADDIEVRAQDTLLGFFGFNEMTEREGAGQQDIDRSSRVLTKEALNAFLNVELSSDAGCLGLELPNLTLPTPGSATYDADFAAVKGALDAYLVRYSAIQVILLSTGNVIRDNASRDTLNMTLVDGSAGSMPYSVYTRVAAMDLESTAATIAHETGHNLDFPDLYNNSNDETDEPSEYHPQLLFPESYDLMASHSAYNHVSTPTKQSYHGWIESIGINHGDVLTISQGTQTQVVLTPQEYGRGEYDDLWAPGSVTDPIAKMLILNLDAAPDPTALAPDHYLSVEWRQQAPSYGTSTYAGGEVYVADNISDLTLNGAYNKPISRNYSHRLGTAGAGDTRLGEDMFPTYPGLVVEGIMTIPGPTPTAPPSILVHVDFPQQPAMDLAIDPWLAPEQYATPSIWFEHATTVDPPTNVMPTAEVGNVVVPKYVVDYVGEIPLNWIHIKVDNDGVLDATDVQLKVSYNSPGGSGDPLDWTTLTITDGVDIAAGGYTIVTVPWSPGAETALDPHTCIAAEVYSWKDAASGLQLADINPHNNIAQENIFELDVTSGSPWHDRPFQFTVNNGYDRSVLAQVAAEGLPPGFSVTFDDAEPYLLGHQTKLISGVLSWDSNTIPYPNTQDPNDPFWSSCADESGTVYEAENMDHTVGYAVEGGWNLSEDGYLFASHSFDGNPTTITVTARGEWGQGWPVLQLFLSEVYIGEAVVDSSDYREYTFEVPAFGGSLPIVVFYGNDAMGYGFDRNLIVDRVVVGNHRPAHCGGLWNIAAYARIGDYRVPLGGVSFNAIGKPRGTLTSAVDVDANGDVEISGSVDPPVGDQTIRIVIRYPSGTTDVIDVQTEGDGTFSHPFTPDERGPITVTTEIPPGGTFAPVPGDEIDFEACIPPNVL